ncbi:MAG: endolytic transglycosylase MltG [Gammaproteobacteria bacterium]|nr:endolytic transglycosylase MltG [Gammaproteobacteria bacterium]
MLNRLLGILILACSILLAWGWIEYNHFIQSPLNLPDEGLTYQLHPGSSVHSLSADLANKGVIEHPLLLRLYARLTNQAGNLKAGEYWIPIEATPGRLLEILSSGKVLQHALTLVEGWTFKQMMSAIQQHPVLEHRLTGLSDKAIMQRLGYPDEHPEGRFYPDTYHFPRGTTDVEFLRRAYRQMQQFLAAEWAKRDENLPLRTPYEALILASIVERETALPEERAKIAGVFIRRLRKGMRLQTDPTVIYGMGDAFDGNIRRRDLQTDTPYNTYVHKGLTPTPIAMPSGAAIRAVCHPESGNALYFVATGDGGHIFSATLDEHNRAVRKYQLKQ